MVARFVHRRGPEPDELRKGRDLLGSLRVCLTKGWSPSTASYGHLNPALEHRIGRLPFRH